MKIIRIIYYYLRKLFPNSINGYITFFLFKTRLKPTTKKIKNNNQNNGIIIFSADFELAWAFRYSNFFSNYIELGIQERDNFPNILSIFNNYGIPVTWATVGHLFLEKCEIGTNNIKHEDSIRPNYFENRNWTFNNGDWYDHDPATDYRKDPAWYAPDLIKQIIDSKVNHEIACHTFSHIDFSDKNCSPELAENELSICIELAQRYNVELKSMVFPGGTAGNYNVLKEKGFICYRKPMSFDIDYPKIDDFGLVQIPSSYGLDKPPYNWSSKVCYNIVKSFVDKAAKNKQVAHFWFHPSMNPWYMKEVLPLLVKYVSDMRAKGFIDVLTMNELANQVLNDTVQTKN